MDASGFFGEIGISILVDRSLIIISDNKLTMHDLLQKMGKEIVRQESVIDPGKRSRLWYHEDIYQILRDHTGTKRIQGISLDMSQVEEMSLIFHTFQKMRNLRFLRFYGENKFKILYFEVSGSILTKLRFFEWQGYPLKSLPSCILVENLVLLILRWSKIEQLWDGVQNLANLKDIDLSSSNRLRRLPDLSLARNLENLNLNFCSSLVETHPSIQHLNKLVVLKLFECRSLKLLPSSIDSESLQFLDLSHCSNLKRLPEILSCNLENLNLYDCGIEEFPSSIEFLSRLDTLDLSNCSRLQRLPDELGNLEALKSLSVDGTSIRELSSSILRLKNLEKLYFKRCRGHELKDFILPSLSSGGVHSLTSLTLIDCGITKLPENIDQLSFIEVLNLAQNNFDRIPESIINLSKLKCLFLSYCKRLRYLPKLPCSLTYVDADHCIMLEGLSGLSILFTIQTSSGNFQSIRLSNCFKLDQNELRKIVENGLQIVKLNSQTYGLDGFGNICFPGTEIPECFEYRNMGSSIKFKLPPGVCHNKLVGFAFCVAFGDQHDQTDNGGFEVYCEWKFKKDDGNWHADYSLPGIVSAVDYVESDHVTLGYELFSSDGHDFCKYSHNKEGLIQFSVRRRLKSVEVKRCGIRLFYSKDFEESKEDRSSSFSIDKEQETHLPKRLKYTTSSF